MVIGPTSLGETAAFKVASIWLVMMMSRLFGRPSNSSMDTTLSYGNWVDWSGCSLPPFADLGLGLKPKLQVAVGGSAILLPQLPSAKDDVGEELADPTAALLDATLKEEKA